MGKGKHKKSKTVIPEIARDPHVLYENAVQGVESQLDLMERVYRRRNGRGFTRLREDFCGTAHLACAWLHRDAQHRAWGVDLDGPTLAWCRRHHVPNLADGEMRLALLQEDVRTADTPPVDMACAFNFSYNVFKERAVLRDYFARVRSHLAPRGMLMIDAYGGPTSHDDVVEKRKVRDGIAPDGTPVPPYTFTWEQRAYNPITHELKCAIHFKLADGTRLRNAFTYDWRLWTVPELREILTEAGYRDPEVYLQGWNEEKGEPDGVFRRRTTYPGWETWYGYIAAARA